MAGPKERAGLIPHPVKLICKWQILLFIKFWSLNSCQMTSFTFSVHQNFPQNFSSDKNFVLSCFISESEWKKRDRTSRTFCHCATYGWWHFVGNHSDPTVRTTNTLTHTAYWSPERVWLGICFEIKERRVKALCALTAAKCPSPTDSPMASGADPLTSLRRLSVTANTHRTSWRVARNSMMKPCPTPTLFSCKRERTTV